MRMGQSPGEAAANAIRRITRFYPDFSGVIVAVNKRGEHSASCHGLANFTYSYRSANDAHVQMATVDCV
jgi:N4-(beta-N-acetylglucosaminyl)-L-asparaginase